MRMLFATMVFVFGLSGQAQAKAVYFTGNYLHGICQSKTLWKKAQCGGYVLGVADALGDTTYNDRCFTLQEKASLQQVADIVKAWLEKNPGERHFTAHSLVAKALAEVWPCK